MKKWRKRSRGIYTQPIYEKDLPVLFQAMIDDGLGVVLESSGVAWFLGEYRIAPKVIRDVWGLTPHQYRRLVDYVVVNC
tara:strand:+ start:8674 stop:8910 length:237 start_codon:yes stop_codon:yes gene_type:complete